MDRGAGSLLRTARPAATWFRRPALGDGQRWHAAHADPALPRGHLPAGAGAARVLASAALALSGSSTWRTARTSHGSDVLVARAQIVVVPARCRTTISSTAPTARAHRA